jgi:hypothetical protein
MSNFEILTLMVACLAVLVSLYTLGEQRKLQRESNEFQRTTAELAKRQISELEQVAAARLKASIEVELHRERISSKLRIANVGGGEASAVNVVFDLPAGVKDPLSPDDRAQRLPIKCLQANTSALVPCDIYMEHSPVLDGYVSRVNSDGSEAREPFKVFT